jgi:hypothetical protein
MALFFLKPFGKKVNSIKKKMLRNWATPDGLFEYINYVNQPIDAI